MKRAKYLLTLFLGTLCYVVLSVTVGQNSLRSISQMEEQKRLVSRRTTEIQNINSELSLELNALQNDKAVIAAYARKLDYVCDGEKLVKITGLKPFQTALYDTGKILRHEEPVFLSEKYCKIISVFLAALCFVIFVLYDLNHGIFDLHKKDRPIITGIPVYDVTQI